MATKHPLHDLIRDQAARYVTGREELDRFREEFLRLSWDVDETSDFQAQSLAHAIEHLFSELSNCALDENTFKDAIIRVALMRPVSSSANRSGDVLTITIQPLPV